jgi:hypothetical protein
MLAISTGLRQQLAVLGVIFLFIPMERQVNHGRRHREKGTQDFYSVKTAVNALKPSEG